MTGLWTRITRPFNNGNLLKAVKQGNLALVGALIDKGADVNAQGEEGMTALHFAALLIEGECKDKLAIAEMLISKGANVNATNDMSLNPLGCVIDRLVAAYCLCTRNTIEQEIFKTKQQQEQENWKYDSWQRDLFENKRAIIELLVNNGDNIDAKYEKYRLTPLMMAVSFNLRDLAGFLIKNGADIHLRDKSGRSPASIVEQKGYADMADFLSERSGT